jgi:shikimate kinase
MVTSGVPLLLPSQPKLIVLHGITCSGKDTIAEAIATTHGFGLIQVGKEFRKRYPPDHFKGLGAMPSTEKEAFEIFKEQYEAAKDKPVILCVSYPRIKENLDCVLEYNPRFVYIHTRNPETYEKRLLERFPKDSEGYNLSKARLTNDRTQGYNLLMELMANPDTAHHVRVVFNDDSLVDAINQVMRMITWV